MSYQIRVGSDHDIEEIVHLSLLAWEPVFESYRQVLGPDIFPVAFPHWQKTQKETVETYCKAREDRVLLVAEADGRIAGFLSYDLNHKHKIGEIVLLAVLPDYQNMGIGTELNNVALVRMKESGMKVATVGTGGDPGHAPARRSYEKVGFIPLPAIHYYQYLSE